MHRAAYQVVAAECKGEVGYAAGGAHAGQVFLDPAHRLDEIDGVTVVFGNPRPDGKDIDIEDDILRGNADPREQAEGPLRDGGFPVIGGRLSLLVEGHHDHRRSQPVDLRGLFQKRLFTVLEADGVDDAFPLCVLEAGEDAFPVRGIDHQRGLRHRRIVLQRPDKGFHRPGTVQHGIVHVDVDDAGPGLDLAGRHPEGGVVIPCRDQAGELPAPGDVRPFADEGEIPFPGIHQISLQPANDQFLPPLLHGSWRQFRQGPDMRRSGAAAASGDVHQPVHPRHLGGHLGRRLVIPAQFIGQARVRIADERHVAESGDLLHERQHPVRAERTVHAESRERIVPHGREKGLQRLAGQGPAAPVGHGDRHDDRETIPHLLNGIQGRFHVQRIEGGLDEQDVHASLDEGRDLLPVTCRHVVETILPFCGTGHVRGKRQRLGCGADTARHPYLTARLFGAGTGDPGPGKRHFTGPFFQSVLLLGDPVRTESIGFDKIRTGFDISLMDRCDDIRPRQVQAFVVPLQRDLRIHEDTLPEIRFRQGVSLDQGAGGSVQAEDASPDMLPQVRHPGAVIYRSSPVCDRNRRFSAGSSGRRARPCLPWKGRGGYPSVPRRQRFRAGS